MAKCSLFHSSSKLWMEFLCRSDYWYGSRVLTIQGWDSREMVCGLEAHTGTSEPNPVLIPLYHNWESTLFSRVWEEWKWCSHFYFISHSTLQVSYGLNETTSAGRTTKTTMYIIVTMGKCIHTFKHQPSLQTFKLGSVWVGQYWHRLFRDHWGNPICPTFKILTISWGK